jgi:hypothetical protein
MTVLLTPYDVSGSRGPSREVDLFYGPATGDDELHTESEYRLLSILVPARTRPGG